MSTELSPHLRHAGPSPRVESRSSRPLAPALRRSGRATQRLNRALDLVGATALLCLLAAPMLLVALLIKFTSRGGAIYRQERVGLGGKTFVMFKFRTMRLDAEAASGPVWARRNDPRRTGLGVLLRRLSIDELPQLFNVLRGDMSLVGPRPERPEHVARLQQKIPFYRTRLAVRPGLTGWAQVRYSYGSDDNDALVKLQYDLYYIRHSSLLLDLNILLRTVGKVLSLSGV